MKKAVLLFILSFSLAHSLNLQRNGAGDPISMLQQQTSALQNQLADLAEKVNKLDLVLAGGDNNNEMSQMSQMSGGAFGVQKFAMGASASVLPKFNQVSGGAGQQLDTSQPSLQSYRNTVKRQVQENQPNNFLPQQDMSNQYNNEPLNNHNTNTNTNRQNLNSENGVESTNINELGQRGTQSPAIILPKMVTEEKMLGQKAFQRTNDFRLYKGSSECLWDDSIYNACLIHSKGMAAGTDKYSHDGFDRRVQQWTFSVLGAAENLAKAWPDDTEPVNTMIKMLVGDAPHQKNMLGPWTRCASAVAKGPTGYFMCQGFGKE